MNSHLTKDGKKFIIRRPDENDAENIINYAKALFVSTDQVLTTLEEYTITLQQEKAWITNSLRDSGTLILIAELDDQVVGLLDFAAKPKKKSSHTGEFGISVHAGHQGIGIGRALVESLLKWARDNSRIEKVFLNVFETNQRAISLYKSLGFIEEGRHIRAIKQATGEYLDILQLYIETR